MPAKNRNHDPRISDKIGIYDVPEGVWEGWKALPWAFIGEAINAAQELPGNSAISINVELHGIVDPQAEVRIFFRWGGQETQFRGAWQEDGTYQLHAQDIQVDYPQL